MDKQSFLGIPHLGLLIRLLATVMFALPQSPISHAQDSTVPTLNLHYATNPLDQPRPINESDLVVEILYVGLTDVDPLTQQVVPELARHWDISDDGQTWIFTLREDVYWFVQGNPAPMRLVNADDVVASIKRACDPRMASHHVWFSPSLRLAPLLVGCQAVWDIPVEAVTDALVYGDTIGVEALDGATVVVHLTQPIGYLHALLTHPTFYPMPYDVPAPAPTTVPTYTSGPYRITSVSTEQVIMTRNSLYPNDLQHGGNIERIRVQMVEYVKMERFIDGAVDWTPYVEGFWEESSIPPDVQFTVVPRMGLYLAVNMAAPPLDNARVRQALALVLQDSTLFTRSGVQPMSVLIPAWLPLASVATSAASPFDPTLAQQLLAEAGYPDCEGLPPISVADYGGHGGLIQGILEYGVTHHLGCPDGQVVPSTYEWANYVSAIRHSGPTDPALWLWPTRAIFPDPHAWLMPWLHCQAETLPPRPCGELDTQLVEAAATTDPAQRQAIYATLESQLIGEGGFALLMPFSTDGAVYLHRGWLTGPFGSDGIQSGMHWDAYSIDMELRAARLAEIGGH